MLWISKEAMLLLCKLTKSGDETACEGGPNRDTAQVSASLLTGLSESSKCTKAAHVHCHLGPTVCMCAEVRYKAQWNWVRMQILTNHVRNSSSFLPSCFLRVRYPLETNGLSHLLSTAAFNGSQGCLCHRDLARTEAPCS